jgi:hypothetical protein
VSCCGISNALIASSYPWVLEHNTSVDGLRSSMGDQDWMLLETYISQCFLLENQADDADYMRLCIEVCSLAHIGGLSNLALRISMPTGHLTVFQLHALLQYQSIDALN